MTEPNSSGSTGEPAPMAIDTTEMLARERDAVRRLRGNKPDDAWSGLALSGGGIRSASFALGVMQALENEDVMQRFDYLSTVSGGGYIGSALTYFMTQHAKTSSDPRAYWFPFGKYGQTGARGDRVFATAAQPSAIRGTDEELPTEIVSFIRQQAHYLTPTPKLGVIALIANALRAVLFSVGIYFTILVVIMMFIFDLGRPEGWIHGLLLQFWPWLANVQGCVIDWISYTIGYVPFLTPISEMPNDGDAINIFAGFALVSFVVFAGFAVVYSILSYLNDGRKTRWFYKNLSINTSIGLGRLLTCQVAALIVGSLPWAYEYAGGFGGNVAGATAVAIAYVGTFMEKHAAILGKLTRSMLWTTIMPFAYAVLAIYGILFLSFGTAQTIIESADHPAMIFALLAIGVLVFGWFVNLNLVSQHRMYRDRLMEALCPDIEAVKEGKWRPADTANALRLSHLPGSTAMKIEKQAMAPYHLINTTLIIPDSKKPKYASRGGDSFVMSPNWCGSDATRWMPTTGYMDNRMVLPTAMAISGAALNAHSGGDGKGPLRSPIISFLVTLFGVQLGYWAPNPRNIDGGCLSVSGFKPNYLRPGIMGLTGAALDEYNYFLQLSDGGHFENLGLYELIRRKLRVIVVSDGGQDAKFAFEDLGNAIERVRVDFGVSIDFVSDVFTLAGILPQVINAQSPEWKIRYGLASRGFAAAWINYPGEEMKGILLYVKATMIENLPSDLYSYKAMNEEFPDQSTLDQDFDEDQFESYRELGYHLAKNMIEEIDRQPPMASPEADIMALARRYLRQPV